MLNIIIGLIFVVGGLSGTLAFRGFNSPELLAAVGAVMIVWGIMQVRRSRADDASFQQRRDEMDPSPEFHPPGEEKDQA